MVTQSIPLVADLRNQNRNIGTIYLATGLVTEGDTGGGIYFWNPYLTNPDDGFYYLQVTGVATGRWTRIYAGSNIYNTDGSLLDNRDVTLNNYYLKFIGSSANSTFNADGSVTLSSLSGVNTRMVVANNAGTLSAQSFVPGTTVRFVEKYTATLGQIIFNTTNTLYSDLFDVFLNGVKLNTDSFSFTANQITLFDSCFADDVIDVVGFSSATVYASLPPQAGNAGKYLSTNGTNLSWESISLTGYVPYTGATANVDLGEYELKAGQLSLDVSPTGVASVGTTRWNNTIGISETTLKGGSVILKNGVDLVARIVNKVTPNATLTKAAYQAVRVSGAQGQRLAVAYAQANNDASSADTIGIVTETIPTNQEGFIMTVGSLENINTTGSLQGETWADGDVLYLSPTVPGAITNIKPTGATGHIVVMGYVEYAHVNNGKIYVKIMNGWELDELHNVYITSPTNNDALIYESSTQLWKNKTIATALGYTPVPTTRTLTINGTAYDLSADRSWTVSSANIYTADGTLTADRTITSNGNSLTILGGKELVAGDQTALQLKTSTTGKQLSLYLINTNTTTGKTYELRSETDGTFRIRDLTQTIFQRNSSGQIGIGNGSIVGTASTTIFGYTNNTGMLKVTGVSGTLDGNGLELFFTGNTSYAYSFDRSGSIWRNLEIGALATTFRNSGNTTMTLTSAGRLLLGTTTESTYLLDVNGTARIQGNLHMSAGSYTSGITSLYRDNSLGLVLTGSGSASDVTIANNIGQLVMRVPTGTRNALFDGTVSSVDLIVGSGRLNDNGGTYGTTLWGRTGNTGISVTITNGGGNVSSGYNIYLFNDGYTGIGSTTAFPSAQLAVTSTTRGFLPPRMTSTQKSAISTPATGLVIYQTDSTEGLYQYKSTGWEAIGGGGANIYNSDGTLTATTRVLSYSVTGNYENKLIFRNTGVTGGPNDDFIFEASIATVPKLIIWNPNYGGAVSFFAGQIGFAGGRMYLSTIGHDITFSPGGVQAVRFFNGTGNVVIQNGGTFVDSGYRLDVNGTARFQDSLTCLGQITTKTQVINAGSISSNALIVSSNSTFAIGSTNGKRVANFASDQGDLPGILLGYDATDGTGIIAGATQSSGSGIDFYTFTGSAWGSRARITKAGRLLLGTTTESTYLLDVNGTARVSGDLSITSIINGSIPISSSTFCLNISNNSGQVLFRVNNNASSVLFLDGNSSLSTGSTINSVSHAGFIIGVSSIHGSTGGSNGGQYFGAVDNASNLTRYMVGHGSKGLKIELSPTSTFETSALLQVSSTTKGFLPPRMTATQLAAISSPAVGLVAYQTDGTEGLYQYKSTGWTLVGGTGGGSGTVTTVSVATANGFAGTVANASTTPAITLSTTVTGLLKGNGTAISAATAGTDYLTPADEDYSVTSQTSNYTETVTRGTKIIKCDTTGGAFTVTLPTAVGNKALLIIKKVAGSVALTIDGNSTETIDGGLTATINKVYESITLISDNSNWQIV